MHPFPDLSWEQTSVLLLRPKAFIIAHTRGAEYLTLCSRSLGAGTRFGKQDLFLVEMRCCLDGRFTSETQVPISRYSLHEQSSRGRDGANADVKA